MIVKPSVGNHGGLFCIRNSHSVYQPCEYADAARQTDSPVTPAGLLDHLTRAAGSYEQMTAHDAVFVRTMPQSKGP
ncbi:ATP-dependent nuclease, subunit A [Brevibacterium aurantiacum]|uniref:ATP-dependent nuclease, subunit A n=1 Tax=Brevibacterium aurantiacum TaxID=273384 RepID=A0A1D7W515_BREAU|nr:ATP-dependent nuclease, subunit A [Brevibacterium aurantiacum]RCS99713.1 hypothetical protein CIK60_03535 [Brevibacterium aurantiacum]